MRNGVLAAAGVACMGAGALGAGERAGSDATLESLLRGGGAQPQQGEAGTAQDAGAGDALSEISFRLRGGAGYRAEADLEDDGGSVSVTRLGSSLAISGQPDARSSLTLQLGAAFSFYDFSGVDTLMPGGVEPLDEAAEYDIGLAYSRQLDDTWAVFVGASVKLAGASGASWDDAVLWSGFGGATYRVSDRVRIGVGVGIASRLEDDARFIPIPIIEWQITDTVRLRTIDRTLDVRGLELGYQATESLELFVLAGWSSHEFRLDEDGPTPDGVFREERVPVMGGVSWAFAEQASVEVALGVDAWTNYEVLDAGGDELVDTDADPALVGWLGLTLRF